MKTYKQRKAEARNKAIDWQYSLVEKNYTMYELCEYCKYFSKLGKKYGLIKEFKENGII